MQHHAEVIFVSDPGTFTLDSSDTEVVYVDHDRVGVGEARVLVEEAHRTPYEAATKTLVIRSYELTVEAQNACLKLFESPPETTRFVLVLPPRATLLPTLRSRLQERHGGSAAVSAAAWSEFLAADVADRLDQIQSWQKKKDTEWLRGIESGLQDWIVTVAPTPTVTLVATRLGTRGASNKMLLEALALDTSLQKK